MGKEFISCRSCFKKHIALGRESPAVRAGASYNSLHMPVYRQSSCHDSFYNTYIVNNVSRLQNAVLGHKTYCNENFSSLFLKGAYL